MTDKIWKYTVNPIYTETTHFIPKGSSILHVGRDIETGLPALWMLVGDEFEQERRSFIIVGTGHNLPDKFYWKYVGTAVCDNFVWHVFERKQT